MSESPLERVMRIARDLERTPPPPACIDLSPAALERLRAAAHRAAPHEAFRLPTVGTLFGIPLEVDELLDPGAWLVVRRRVHPRPERVLLETALEHPDDPGVDLHPPRWHEFEWCDGGGSCEHDACQWRAYAEATGVTVHDAQLEADDGGDP